MPNHIRENLPEELSDLPADLIYATNIRVHEFSYSAAALQSAEARESLKEELRVRCGGTWSQWPGWAVHAAMRARTSSSDEEADVESCSWRVAMRGRLPACGDAMALLSPRGDAGTLASSIHASAPQRLDEARRLWWLWQQQCKRMHLRAPECSNCQELIIIFHTPSRHGVAQWLRFRGGWISCRILASFDSVGISHRLQRGAHRGQFQRPL